MLEEIHTHVRKGESFAFETTLSGRHYALLIPQWRGLGYKVKLIFLSLPTPAMAIERVRVRVAQGGLNVPADIIRRRFFSGRRNFENMYQKLVDAWVLYDNSGEKPLLLDEGEMI